MDKAKETANADPAPANAGDQTSDTETQAQSQSNSLVRASKDDLLSEVTQLRATTERLLQESKQYKSKYHDVKSKWDQEQTKKQEEQGKYKELWEKSQGELTELQSRIVETEKQKQFASMAQQVGCVDPEVAYGCLAHMLSFDIESLKLEDPRLLLEDLKRSKPYLFSNPKPASVNPVPPSHGGQSYSEKRLSAAEIAKLPPDQKKAAWSQAFGAHWGKK